MYKKDLFTKQEKSYLQDRLTKIIPILMEKVVEDQNGNFIFEHATFPDLRVQGVTISFVQEHLERAIKKQLKNQSDKHVDYILKLLLA